MTQRWRVEIYIKASRQDENPENQPHVVEECVVAEELVLACMKRFTRRGIPRDGWDGVDDVVPAEEGGGVHKGVP